VTTYEEYRQLRRDIGYPEENAINEFVWNDCHLESQENMLGQLRPHAAAARERHQAYGEDHW
jgi:hypothetical protein